MAVVFFDLAKAVWQEAYGITEATCEWITDHFSNKKIKIIIMIKKKKGKWNTAV